jgi:hypothetical protein
MMSVQNYASVRMSIYTHMCIYVYIYTHKTSYTYVYVHIYIYIYIHEMCWSSAATSEVHHTMCEMHADLVTCTYRSGDEFCMSGYNVCFVRVCVCVRIYIHTYIYTQICHVCLLKSGAFPRGGILFLTCEIRRER